ncbi:MAG: LysR family transcriptional regulator [Peptococcaceae bacterium]|nr:LysR family transcriptional regulator [Peptococcaceae bacterium]
MKIEYLRYFLTLANASSISQAADELFLSQQQLTRIISALEEELDVTLFLRSKKGITLTADGKELLPFAQNLLTDYNSMKNHFFMRKQECPIDAKPALCKIFLAPCLSLHANDIVSSFQKTAPNIQLIIYDKPNKLNESYFDKDALCFWAVDINEQDLILPGQIKLQKKLLGSCSSYLVYSKHMLPIDTAVINGEDVSTIALSHAYATYENNTTFRLISSNVYQILDSVVQNNTICTLPDFALAKAQSLYPDLTFTPVRDGTVPLNVLYPETHVLTEADEIVINFMKSYIQNLQFMAKQIL